MVDENTAMRELHEVFADLDALLKNPDVGSVLTARGLNTSLVIVAAEALKAYVDGDKERAAEDFQTVAEEIATRHAVTGAKDSKADAPD